MSDSLQPHGSKVAHQAPLSVGLSRQEYWKGLAIPFSRDLSDPEMEPGSPALRADSLPSEPPGKHLFSGSHVYPHLRSLAFI